MRNFKFILVISTFGHNFGSCLLVLINFKPIWMICCGFGDVEKSKKGGCEEQMN